MNFATSSAPSRPAREATMTLAETVLRAMKSHDTLFAAWRAGSDNRPPLLHDLHDKNKDGKLTSAESKVARERRKAIEGDPSRARVWIYAQTNG
jgi:hypothetical protein